MTQIIQSTCKAYFIQNWRPVYFFERYLIVTLDISLKGAFAKNERGYRLTAKNYRWWSQPILLLSVASIMRKLLKMTLTEERSKYKFGKLQHTTWIVKNQFNIKQIIQILKPIWVIFRRIRIYGWYFKIVCTCFIYNALKTPISLSARCLCFRCS